MNSDLPYNININTPINPNRYISPKPPNVPQKNISIPTYQMTPRRLFPDESSG